MDESHVPREDLEVQVKALIPFQVDATRKERVSPDVPRTLFSHLWHDFSFFLKALVPICQQGRAGGIRCKHRNRSEMSYTQTCLWCVGIQNYLV